MIFKSANLTLVTEDGTEYHPNISQAKLAAIVRSCGYRIGDVDEKEIFCEWNDKTIEGNILPLLPKIN